MCQNRTRCNCWAVNRLWPSAEMSQDVVVNTFRHRPCYLPTAPAGCLRVARTVRLWTRNKPMDENEKLDVCLDDLDVPGSWDNLAYFWLTGEWAD